MTVLYPLYILSRERAIIDVRAITGRSASVAQRGVSRMQRLSDRPEDVYREWRRRATYGWWGYRARFGWAI